MDLDPNFSPVGHEFEYRMESCNVTVYKTGKVTYKAIGTYGDRQVEGQSARSTDAALENWKSAAKYSDPDD
jgi:hypothetical protein